MDLKHGGHHKTYIEHFEKAIRELGYNVIVLYPEAISEAAPHTSSNQSSTYIRARNIFPSFIAESYRFRAIACWLSVTWAIFSNQVRGKITRPDFVFFCWIDDFRFGKDHPLITKFFLRIVAMTFKYKWSGLYFHPVHLRNAKNKGDIDLGQPNKVHNIDQIFSADKCTSVAILDEGVQRSLEHKVGKRVLIFPDIANDELDTERSVLARTIKTKSGSRKIVALLGALNKRKGLMPLLEIAELANKNDDNWFFVVVGGLDKNDFTEDDLEKIRASQNDPNTNCYFHLDPVEDGNEFNAIVAVSDLLYANYLQFPHSSNILTKAAIFRTPVLVSSGYCMEERVKQFGLGEAAEEGNVEEIYQSINSLLTNFDAKSSEVKFEDYQKVHSKDALSESFGQVINRIEV